MTESCYAGLSPDGKMVLTPQFAESIRRFYAEKGWSLTANSAVGRGRAMDAAPDLWAAEDAAGDRYTELNRDYDRLLRSGEQPTIRPTIADHNFEGRAEATRGRAAVVHAGFTSGDPSDEDSAVRKYKAAHGWDSVDPLTEKEIRRNFRMEEMYRALLNADQPLPPLDSRDERGGL
jgi:hypothetical protein